jgi:hypothetical protein
VDILKNAITPQNVDKKFSFRTGRNGVGVKGMLPLNCLPLWGERGSPSLPLLK